MDIAKFAEIAPYLSSVLVLVGFLMALFFGFYKQLVAAGIFPELDQNNASPILALLINNGLKFSIAVLVFGVIIYSIDNFGDTFNQINSNASNTMNIEK